MRVRCPKASILILCTLLSLSFSLAAPKGNGKAKGSDKEPQSQAGNREKEDKEKGKEAHDTANGKDKDSRAAVNIFVQGDRDLIKRHFSANQGNLPPGLAKRGDDLPPGLEKQLQRNGHLPPGLEKKLNPFPAELERRLPPLREGLMRGVIGDSAIIMERKTSRILDVFGIR
jgi:hypothetical protein